MIDEGGLRGNSNLVSRREETLAVKLRDTA